MSIINEALKKTQQKLSRASSLAPTLPDSVQKKDIWSWTLITLIVASLGCAVSLTALMYSRQQAMALSLDKRKIKIMETVKKEYLPAIPSPVSGKTKPEDVAINGIVTMGQERFALLNNEIYGVGDYVGERRILSISSDQVELLDKENNILVLKTKRSSGRP